MTVRWMLLVSMLYLDLVPVLLNAQSADADPLRPKRTLKEYFDAKYLLYKLPDNYYDKQKVTGTFSSGPANFLSGFKPMGYSSKLNLQYTHVFSKQCVYYKGDGDTMHKYAEVRFPNTCPDKKKIEAEVTIQNSSNKKLTYYVRLFYQNTSYWYPTNDSIQVQPRNYLDNYYGMSDVMEISVNAGEAETIKIPYNIGLDPKSEYEYDPSKAPARPGNYEFMVLALPYKDPLMMDENLNLQIVNPFAEVKTDQLFHQGKSYFDYSAYAGPHHFKFVFLDEYFDGKNDLQPNHIYLPKSHTEKKLCDTCTGWYRANINENWIADDFFKGDISKAGFVKADYGIRRENYKIDSNGITLLIPKSKPGDYKKTWGEFNFGPSFKYGHLTVRAKMAQIVNKSGTPNGIVHNVWLYQRDREPVKADMYANGPYKDLHNASGGRPFEIDLEFWTSSSSEPSTIWNSLAFINYSVVDYMRDTSVKIKPGEQKTFGKYTADRFDGRQLNVMGKEFENSFFEQFHTYELYWYPDHLQYLVDGVEKALITKDMAKIPDQYLFLWIGSPLYQDGTYYTQSFIPFLKEDKKSIIDYIRIE